MSVADLNTPEGLAALAQEMQAKWASSLGAIFTAVDDFVDNWTDLGVLPDVDQQLRQLLEVDVENIKHIVRIEMTNSIRAALPPVGEGHG